jgi:hypothetical protein
MVGTKRKKTLVDAGKDWEELEYGRKTAFMAIRVMLEQMVFDRTRVVLDGIGDAGLSAFRFATWYPSLFSGAIGRDVSPDDSLIMENARGISFVYLSSSENKATDAAKEWAKKFGEGQDPQVTWIEDSGMVLEPSQEAVDAIKSWMGNLKKETTPKQVYLKTADLQIAGSHWLRIDDLNAGLDMKPDDPNYPWVEGKIDSDSNSIILKSNRVLRLKLFLNDKLLNLDKKVTVILNGKNRFEGTVERNLDKMLDLVYQNPAGDYEIYCNSLDLSEEE